MNSCRHLKNKIKGQDFRVICALLLLAIFLVVGTVTAEDTNEITGHIDQINGEQIIIDDCSYAIPPATLFFNKDGSRAHYSSLHKGSLISYQEDEKGHIISLTILALDQNIARSKLDSEKDKNKSQDITTNKGKMILKDGIWSN